MMQDLPPHPAAPVQSVTNERYRKLFNKMNDAAFVCYINFGNTLSNFVEVNDTACLRFGYSREELLEVSPLTIISGNFEEEIRNIIDKLFATGEMIFEAIHLTKNGCTIRSELSAHLIEYNERPAILAISRDVSARQKIEEKLKQRTEQLRNLASRLQKVREEERTAISREIHDELGSSLTAIKIQASLIGNKLKSDERLLAEKITSVLTIIDRMAEAIHRISAKLRPGILDELGLLPAIEWQCQEFAVQTGIKCSCEMPAEDIILQRDISTAVFRIFQEALTNVARHANANNVDVTLRVEDSRLSLLIRDNGKGITKTQINDMQSLGLLGMRERAMVFGGSVEIKSSMNSGTTVNVEIPRDKC